MEQVNSALDAFIKGHGEVKVFEERLNLLLQTYVTGSSTLPDNYKKQFEKISSISERLAYVVIDDKASISAVEGLIERLIASEAKSTYFLSHLQPFRKELQQALGNSLFQFEDHFFVIHENEFKYPFAAAVFEGVSSKIKTGILVKEEDEEAKVNLAFLAYLNRCPSSDKEAINSLFGGELTRCEDILQAKGELKPEEKAVLNNLRDQIHYYDGEGSSLNKRVLSRLAEGLRRDFTALIEARETSANDKLKKLFEEIFPSYFPESIPQSQELLQKFSEGCFRLLFHGIEGFDLSGVEEKLRKAFLENLRSINLDFGHMDGDLNKFFELAGAHPDYLAHLQSLRLNCEERVHRYGFAQNVLSLFIRPGETIFPRLETLEVHPNVLPPNEGEPEKLGTDYLLSILRNTPSLKTVKMKASYKPLVLMGLEERRIAGHPLALASEAVSSSFSDALGTPVTIDERGTVTLGGGGFTDITIKIGERAV